MATLTSLSESRPFRVPRLRLSTQLSLVVGYVLIEVALWTPKAVQVWVSLLATIWIIASVALSGRSRDELGLGTRGLRSSAWVAASAALLGAAMVAVSSAYGFAHSLKGTLPQIPHALLYCFWALQQEFILQSFLFIGIATLTTTRRAVLIAASLFAIAHLPNPVLTVATFFTGLLLTIAFARYRNIYCLGIAHGLLGLAIAVSLPADVPRNMRVGLGYLTYHSAASAINTNAPIR